VFISEISSPCYIRKIENNSELDLGIVPRVFKGWFRCQDIRMRSGCLKLVNMREVLRETTTCFSPLSVFRRINLTATLGCEGDLLNKL